MNLDDFKDPVETRRLLEHLGHSGSICVPVDCGLLNPKTLPAITELVGQNCIVFSARTTVAVDIYTLMPPGAALCEAAGIACSGTAKGAAVTETAAKPQVEIHTDPESVETLSMAIMSQVKEHFHGAPLSPRNVLDVVNALAVAAGFVIAGTGPAQEQVLDLLYRVARGQVAIVVQAGAAETQAEEARPERLN